MAMYSDVRQAIAICSLTNWRAEAHPTRWIDRSWWRGLQPAKGWKARLGATHADTF
jgi:hypothetical protein